MHTELPSSNGPFVALCTTGKLSEEDYSEIVPLLESRIEEHGKISLFWEMQDFKGWTPKGLWADTKFGLNHRDDFSRIALVGEKKWHEAMSQLMKPFTTAEVRYFPAIEREDALRWAEAG